MVKYCTYYAPKDWYLNILSPPEPGICIDPPAALPPPILHRAITLKIPTSLFIKRETTLFDTWLNSHSDASAKYQGDKKSDSVIEMWFRATQLYQACPGLEKIHGGQAPYFDMEHSIRYLSRLRQFLKVRYFGITEQELGMMWHYLDWRDTQLELADHLVFDLLKLGMENGKHVREWDEAEWLDGDLKKYTWFEVLVGRIMESGVFERLPSWILGEGEYWSRPGEYVAAAMVEELQKRENGWKGENEFDNQIDRWIWRMRERDWELENMHHHKRCENGKWWMDEEDGSVDWIDTPAIIPPAPKPFHAWGYIWTIAIECAEAIPAESKESKPEHVQASNHPIVDESFWTNMFNPFGKPDSRHHESLKVVKVSSLK
jgi:hypothetical protein